MKKGLLLLFFAAAFFFFPSGAGAQVPETVTGVLVEYPECVGDSCSFVQASCSWNAMSGATSYNYTITEVDTSTQIQTATVDSSTLRVVFPVTQERTYKCDVFATNATGSGGTGTHSLLCSAEGLLDPTATTAPQATATPLPTKPPIESPGAFTNTAIILGGIALVIIGGLALILL
jgi:hypothetical protein